METSEQINHKQLPQRNINHISQICMFLALDAANLGCTLASPGSFKKNPDARTTPRALIQNLWSCDRGPITFQSSPPPPPRVISVGWRPQALRPPGQHRRLHFPEAPAAASVSGPAGLRVSKARLLRARGSRRPVPWVVAVLRRAQPRRAARPARF